MLRVTAPPELAEAALSAYAEARPFSDAGVREESRIAHAAALAVSFNDARRHAYARSARSLLKAWVEPAAAAAA